MIDGIRCHGSNETDVVHNRTNLREQFADLGAATTKTLELRLRTEALQWLTLQLCNLLPLGHAFRHQLAIALGQFRLVVKRFQVRWSTGHRQPDHAFDARSVMSYQRLMRSIVGQQSILSEQMHEGN